MLNVPASWHTSKSSCTAAVSLTNRPVLSWVCSTVRLSGLHLSQQIAPFFLKFFAKIISNIEHWSPENGTCSFHFECYQVVPISYELDLDLVELVGRILFVKQQLLLVVAEQLPLLVVEQLPNTIFFSIRVSMRSLVEVEVTCILFLDDFSGFHPNNFLEYNKLDMFTEE